MSWSVTVTVKFLSEDDFFSVSPVRAHSKTLGLEAAGMEIGLWPGIPDNKVVQECWKKWAPPMRGWKEVPETDGRSHADVTAGAETLGGLQTLTVREAIVFSTGRESCRDFEVPIKGDFEILSGEQRG